MAEDKPYGPIDPNSQHQMWSRWIFGVQASPSKMPHHLEVLDNARRYFAKLFKSTVGRVRCDQQDTYFSVIVEIEGPPAHDPEYSERVRKDFIEKFVAQGFGPSARLVKFTVGVLAGDRQDGNPPDQMLVMPTIDIRAALSGE